MLMKLTASLRLCRRLGFTCARLLYEAGRSGATPTASSKMLKASSSFPDSAALIPNASSSFDFLENMIVINLVTIADYRRQFHFTSSLFSFVQKCFWLTNFGCKSCS